MALSDANQQQGHDACGTRYLAAHAMPASPAGIGSLLSDGPVFELNALPADPREGVART